MRRLLLSAAAAVALTMAGAASAETVAITNARILTLGPAGEIANGTVVIRDGKIASVGAGSAAPAGARVVDAKGGIVTPGFVATRSDIGTVEIGQVANDAAVNNPTLSAAFDVSLALNPDSVVIPVARLGGLTRAVVAPRRGGGGEGQHFDDGSVEGADMTAGDESESRAPRLFGGQAAVVHLGKADDILVKPRVGVTVTLGQGGGGAVGGSRAAAIQTLRAALDDVRFYMRDKAAYDRGSARDLGLSRADLEALIPVVQGREPLIVSVNRASDIRQVLRLAREEKVKVILAGAGEAWRVADEIAAAGVPVLLNPLDDLPNSFDVLGATRLNAVRLNQAGVLIALESAGTHRSRETRYGAGEAVAYGLPYEAALKAISLNPAKIFGFSDRFGSLEPGKDADVVVWSGDPLEPLSQPRAIFIRGEQQSLTSRQTELQDRYLDLNQAYPPAYR